MIIGCQGSRGSLLRNLNSPGFNVFTCLDQHDFTLGLIGIPGCSARNDHSTRCPARLQCFEVVARSKLGIDGGG